MTKSHSSRNFLRAAAAGTALFVLADASVALAQVAPEPAAASVAAESGDGLEEIVVTAEKRETNLQRTPIAISVLGTQDLTNRHVQSLGDLADGAIPSLRIVPFFSRNSALTVGIRGIVPFDANQPSRDQSVGIYIDGVYLGRSQGLGVALLDVERIEVLKGPQGTLFGRNSVGGAVSIVSRKPTGEFGLRATAGVRNFDGYNAEAHLDLPRFGDVAVKLDGILTKRGGTVKNTLEGEQDFNRFNRRGIHGAALYEPSDDFSAQIDADYSYDATTPYYVQLLDKTATSPALAPIVQVQPDRAKTVDIGVPQRTNLGETWGVALHMNWTVAPDVELRSITSYRDLEQSQWDNGIGAHAGVFRPNAQFSRYSLATLRQHQASQEFQLVGSTDRLNYVAGLYYYHEAGDDDAWSPNSMVWNATGTGATPLPSLQAGAATAFPDRASTAKADSYAAFGQLTYRPALLNEAASLTVGGRFTHDKKSGHLYKVNGADSDYRFDIKSDHFDPMVTLAVDAATGIHLYGKWGTAYRAGGANSRSLTYRAFGKEEVSTFEAGLKTEFWDRRARVNIAAYTTRYTDIQIDFSAPNINNTNRTTIETVNAPGNGRIKGIEVDASVAPFRGLTLSASYAYTDGKLPVAENPFLNNLPQTVYIVATPEHAGSAAIDFAQPVGFATLRAHMDANVAEGYRAQSGENVFTDNSFVVNGRLALGDIALRGSAQLELALWARNLFNEQHTFLESRAAAAATGGYGIFNDPRTYGVEATIRF
jgi:iron complex outermembrane receptor protein